MAGEARGPGADGVPPQHSPQYFSHPTRATTSTDTPNINVMREDDINRDSIELLYGRHDQCYPQTFGYIRGFRSS